MDDLDREIEDAKSLGVEIVNSAQVQEKVKVKRNRGLKNDILKIIEGNPSLSPKEVFDLIKNNQYGGSTPVSLNTVMSTMSQLKPKVEPKEHD